MICSMDPYSLTGIFLIGGADDFETQQHNVLAIMVLADCISQPDQDVCCQHMSQYLDSLAGCLTSASSNISQPDTYVSHIYMGQHLYSRHWPTCAVHISPPDG